MGGVSLTCTRLSAVTRLLGDMSTLWARSAFPSQTSPAGKVRTASPMMQLCSHTLLRSPLLRSPALLLTCSPATHTCPAGFEAAHLFLKTREVPDVWKMDLSQILDSSSSDDDDDDDDEEKESEEDEEEEEEDEDEKKKINKQIKDEVRECDARVCELGEEPNAEVCLCLRWRRSRTQRRGTSSCSSSTSSWRTEVSSTSVTRLCLSSSTGHFLQSLRQETVKVWTQLVEARRSRCSN